MLHVLMSSDKFELLNQIKYPADLRRLDLERLPEVCKELRGKIIDEVAVNPGHFASSLGAVEITVALHYVFDTPEDRIVWDVGHQAYGHKILTGRRDRFCTNRKLHGICPFPSPAESEYDTFACGHASNSISAALGMAVAANGSGRHVVAVIGDGAMSGGLAFEGLNNVSSTPNDLLIILNDNDMSIDRAVGGMEKYLLNLDTNETYNRLRFKASRWLHSKGYLNEERKKGILRLNNALKSALSHQQNIFEGMNIRYFGPFDGHDVKEVVRVLRQLKDMRGPKLLHLHTTKGKGYEPAEKSATIWHAPGKFDPETGERIVQDCSNMPPKYQDVFGETLLELAGQNKHIVGVTPAMPTGCSMSIMQKAMPDRVFDVGIAEQHAVVSAAGLARAGMHPVVAVYATFLNRAFDQILMDVALHGEGVTLALDRAGVTGTDGLVGEDGPTHHGAFDMAALRPIPNLTIAAPMDEHELRRLMYTAQQPDRGTFVIRYPRGRGVRKDWQCPLEAVEVGTGRKLRDGKQTAVISIGPIGNDVELAITKSEEEVAHYDLRFLKPLDEELLHEVGKRFKHIITIEDGTRNGGMGSAVLEWLSDHGYTPTVKRMGMPDEFVEHGTVAELKRICNMDIDSIVAAIKETKK